jgi:UDP-GlcNAc:undecaprenyl-phosphate GlcNAc-1-phosphate transferase
LLFAGAATKYDVSPSPPGLVRLNLQSFFYYGSAAFFLGLLLTPFVRRMALEWRLVDRPDARKVHQVQIPRLGGVAIFGAFFISSVAIIYHDYFGLEGVALGLLEINKILDGAILILLVGVYDDLFGLSAKKKLAWQVVVAVVMIEFGYLIHQIALPGLATTFDLGWFAYPITVLWIVGVMNALNLIDGLDGLAAGLATIATALLCAIALMNGQTDVAFLCSVLIGSLLGFWVFNMHPASIFMGDSGSLFLGYILSVISIRAVQGESATVAIGAPLLLIGLPLFDTGAAFVRRLVSASGLFQPGKRLRFPPLSAAFQPDRGHIHHRLLVAGFSQRQVVLLLYAIATFLGVSGFLLAMASGIAATLTVAYAGLVLGFVIVQVERLTGHLGRLSLPAGWRESVVPIARNSPPHRVLVVAGAAEAEEQICRMVSDADPSTVCLPLGDRVAADHYGVVVSDCRWGEMLRPAEDALPSRATLIALVSTGHGRQMLECAHGHGIFVVEEGDQAALGSILARSFERSHMLAQNAFLKFFAWLMIALLPLVAYFSAHFWGYVR